MFSRELQERSLVVLTDDNKDRIHPKAMESELFLPRKDRKSRYHFPLICFLKLAVCLLNMRQIDYDIATEDKINIITLSV